MIMQSKAARGWGICLLIIGPITRHPTKQQTQTNRRASVLLRSWLWVTCGRFPTPTTSGHPSACWRGPRALESQAQGPGFERSWVSGSWEEMAAVSRTGPPPPCGWRPHSCFHAAWGWAGGLSCSCSLPSVRRGVSYPTRELERRPWARSARPLPFESSLSPEDYFPPTLHPPSQPFREAGPWCEWWWGAACGGPDRPWGGMQVHAAVASQAPCSWPLISCPMAPVGMSCCMWTSTQKKEHKSENYYRIDCSAFGAETLSVLFTYPLGLM